ncbi:hypothetical protein D5F01_LYC19147 [Larimichthys crocea]|uniref:Murine leukemia virus integrase C-terminal domain-containing protein n=1 Tax=Larimichthys crocea TaxID=215358 RepID=A0A6G0HRE1_LARCR|nr:hypothetical protein D5F01_LYC19147 [Larimichthys crocea]
MATISVQGTGEPPEGPGTGVLGVPRKSVGKVSAGSVRAGRRSNNRAVWKGRGFKKTDGSPIQHHAQIVKLLQAMMKPKEIAIAKCAAHRTDMSRITQGNRAADEAAKAVIGADKPGKVLLVTHEIELEDKITPRDVILMQEAVNAIDKQLWVDRGASQDSTGLWRNHEGLIVAPPDLLGLMIQEAHGQAHVARGEEHQQQESGEENRELEKNSVRPGDKVFVKVFRRKWFNARREGPFEVVRCTGTAVQVKGSPTWYHLSHCVKAPEEETLQLGNEDGNDPEEQTDHVSDGIRPDLSADGQEKRFREVDLQYAPEGSNPPEKVPPEVPEECDAPSRVLRSASKPRSPRPVREKIKPKRYRDCS